MSGVVRASYELGTLTPELHDRFVGAVSHLPCGFESIIKLIRYRFGVKPLTRRDAYARNIGYAFDWRGDPRVEPPEEHLDEPARDLRREHPLGRRVERADVQRARVAQRGGRRTRRERLVHVDEVERRVVEQRLDRARHVDRHRHAAAAPPEPAGPRNDTVVLTLDRLGSDLEYKFHLAANQTFLYSWTATGLVEFDFHGEPDRPSRPGEFSSYEAKQGLNGSGSFQAPFDGRHGWYFRNYEEGAVTVTLRTWGMASVIRVRPLGRISLTIIAYEAP